MKQNFKIFLSILILCNLLTQSYATPPFHILPTDLQLHISLDKNVYELNEEIDIDAVLINKSSKPIKLYSPDYWGVSRIYITNYHGEILKPNELKLERNSFDEFLSIPAGESKSYTLRNLRYFTRGGAAEFQGEAKLKPGVYYIRVEFFNPPNGFEPNKIWAQTWNGALESNLVMITVQ